MSVRWAYVGSRTNEARKARGAGITVWAVEAKSWRLLQTVDLGDPSFLTFDRTGTRLYAAQGDGDQVFALGRDAETGLLSVIGQRPSHGVNGVHVLVDPSNRFVVVTNHLSDGGYSSNLAVFPIRPDGGLDEPTDVRPVTGEPGPNRKEQPYAKPHSAEFSPDGKFLAMADKGLDEVHVFRLDERGVLQPVEARPTRFRWHAGPRKLAFHPDGDTLYVLGELDSTVTVCGFDRETGAISPLQVVSSQSDAWSRIHRASEIAISPDGRTLYTANRGQDTIGVFAVASDSKRLTPTQFAPSGGKVPRHFVLDATGRSLFVANEFSDSITAFSVGDEGKLAPRGVVAETGTPTCILLA
jgi:6-phosphogluconolactonase (cycloisomerase 2 family)